MLFTEFSVESNKNDVVQTRRGGGQASTYHRLSRAKSILLSRKVYFGEHVHNFPHSKKGGLGSQTRFERCILSSGSGKRFQKICQNSSGIRPVGVSGGLFWPKHPPKIVHVTNESSVKTVEVKGNAGVRLFGRHHSVWFNRKFGEKTFTENAGHIRGGWVQGQPEKVCVYSHTKAAAFGVHHRFGKKSAGGAPTQIKNYQKGTGQGGAGPKTKLQKNSQHSGASQKLPPCSAIFKTGNPGAFKVQPDAPRKGLGFLHRHSRKAERGNQSAEGILAARPGQAFPATGKKGAPFRLLHMGMGGSGFIPKSNHPSILEGEKLLTHK
jgi:hypothetical protein